MKLPIKICSRCVMDSTDKKISFNKNDLMRSLSKF